MSAFVVIALNLGCSEGIVVDPPAELGKEEIGIETGETPKPQSRLELLTLIEKKLNFPYATQTALAVSVLAIILSIINKIYHLTTSYPE